MSVPIVEARHLIKHYIFRENMFFIQKQTIHAVDNVSLRIYPGETVGLAGESECGKTTIGRMIVGLEKPTKGEIFFKGDAIFHQKGSLLREYRQKVQYLFQNTYLSFHPQKTVYNIINRGLRNFHCIKDKKQVKNKIIEICEKTRLGIHCLFSYPHELSAEEQQKLAIARTIAVNPELIICDEPLARLDISARAHILDLLMDLKNVYNLSMLFMSQDLAAVKHMSQHILVMYRGRIVESAPAMSLFENTAHPYTKALISAIPEPEPDAYKGKIVLAGNAEPATAKVRGCCFADQCYMVQDICRMESPLGRQLVQGHISYCHFAEKV